MSFKKYVRDVTEPDIDKALSRVGRNLIAALKEAKELDLQYDRAKDGRNDTDFASDLGVSASKVTDWNQAFNAFTDLDEIAEGDDTITIPTGTPFARRIRKFA